MLWRTQFIPTILAASLLLLTACQPVRPTVTELTPAAAAQPTLPAEEAAMADAVALFVAETLGVPLDEVSVQSVAAMQWPDAALGCPQPDMIYAAVVTPGYLVTLEHGGARYAVHTDSRSDGEKIICAQE